VTVTANVTVTDDEFRYNIIIVEVVLRVCVCVLCGGVCLCASVGLIIASSYIISNFPKHRQSEKFGCVPVLILINI